VPVSANVVKLPSRYARYGLYPPMGHYATSRMMPMVQVLNLIATDISGLVSRPTVLEGQQVHAD
jgi:hypothetical protein